MEGAIVLCGLGRMGWRVLEHLKAAGLPVVVIDTACRADDPRLAGVRLVPGDCRRRDTLEAAGVAQARGVLLLVSDDLVNIAGALRVRSLNPTVRIVLRMFNQNLIGRLGKAVNNVFALSTSQLTAPILAMTALTGQALGAFRVEGVDDGLRQVAEVHVTAPSDLRDLVGGVEGGRPGVQVVAHLSAHGKAHYLGDVDERARLEAGDRLVVCGEPRAVAALLAGSGVTDDPEPLWAGLGRRLARVFRRTLAEIDRSVLICFLVLFGVLAVSTIILHLGVEKYSLPVALLRTVAIMATGSDMHEEDYRYGWMRVYVGMLRLSGAALIAAFTAIFTNYLLRARWGGALEVRRIPDGGHVLVCGLGAVGFRVVQELAALKEPVVVIELSANNPFLATARRLGAAVILGDAAIGEVLRQANAGKARAVVAATTDDLVNLEVALLVREQNPRQRIVLLQSDPQLAQMLRDAANVRLAVSVPALAAPAFVAALYGDRVQSVFLVGGDRLMAVIDLEIQEQDTRLKGRPVRQAAEEFRFLPASVRTAKGDERPADAPLEPGDRVVAILALTDLEALLRRPGTGLA
jgi:Trk K+ transport system NAD-binding subunit